MTILNMSSEIATLLLALSIGTQIACSGVDRVTRSFSPRPVHSVNHGSPTSTLDGTKIKIMPYRASFKIPVEWLSEEEKQRNPVGYRENLYISWEALDQLYKIDGDNLPDAEIMDSVLPFELSAVHVGSKGWGNYLSTDLQARVYIIDKNVEAFRESVEKEALERARSVYKTAELKTKWHDEWEGRVMSVLETGEHTLLFKDIAFYYRSFDGKTVVFVFVHQYGWDKTIGQMLNSFEWPDETSKE